MFDMQIDSRIFTIYNTVKKATQHWTPLFNGSLTVNRGFRIDLFKNALEPCPLLYVKL